MKTLLAILLLTVTAQAQEVFLWVRNVDVLTNKLAQIDAFLGYPSPETLTERAINFDLLTNGTNAVIRLDLEAIYSPRLKRYVNWAEKVKDQLTDAQWGLDVCTNATQLVGRPVARISRALAKQIGLAILNDEKAP